MTFIIFGLPRSRTAWLASFLSFNRPVGHDISINCDSIDDFVGSFRNGMVGTVETGAMMAHRVIKKCIPGIKFLVVKRPVEEIYSSFWRQNVYPEFGELEEKERILNEIVYLPGTETFEFRDLSNPALSKWIFEYCLEVPLPPLWWEQFAERNIQVDLPERLSRLASRAPAIAKLKLEVANHV